MPQALVVLVAFYYWATPCSSTVWLRPHQQELYGTNPPARLWDKKGSSPVVLTVVWLVEELLNGQFPGQKEVGEGLARRAVLQEHDGTQGFCHRLV